MSHKTYPCIRVESATRGTKKCSCCELPAVKRVDIETNWFRGDDEVLLVCDAHLVIARAGLFSALYRAQEATNKARRSASEEGPSRIKCPACGKKVKKVGLVDHQLAVHKVVTPDDGLHVADAEVLQPNHQQE